MWILSLRQEAQRDRFRQAIGYGVANDGDVWNFYERKRTAKGCLPIGVILTIAAAGSEMSDSSVITNENGWLKRGYSSDYGRARFAVMDPELTMTLPKYQTGQRVRGHYDAHNGAIFQSL